MRAFQSDRVSFPVKRHNRATLIAAHCAEVMIDLQLRTRRPNRSVHSGATFEVKHERSAQGDQSLAEAAHQITLLRFPESRNRRHVPHLQGVYVIYDPKARASTTT